MCPKEDTQSNINGHQSEGVEAETTLACDLPQRPVVTGNASRGRVVFILSVVSLIMAFLGIILTIYLSYSNYRSEVTQATDGTRKLIGRVRVAALRIGYEPASPLEKPTPEMRKEVRDFETIRYQINNRQVQFDKCLDALNVALKDLAIGGLPAEAGPEGAVASPQAVFLKMTSRLEARLESWHEGQVSPYGWLGWSDEEIAAEECF